jgi:hypothetical protein
MKIPNIANIETGNGNSKETARLRPKDIPIHRSWPNRNCLLLFIFTFYSTYEFLPITAIKRIFQILSKLIAGRPACTIDENKKLSLVYRIHRSPEYGVP